MRPCHQPGAWTRRRSPVAHEPRSAAAEAAAPPNCDGQSIPFTDKLRAVVGKDTLKSVVTCPVTDPDTGDISQQTAGGGTLYQRASTGYSIFFDGQSTHWQYAVDANG